MTRASEEIEPTIIYCLCCQNLLQARTLQKKKSMTVGARTKSHPMAVRLTLVLLRQHSVVFSWHNWLCSSAARRTRSWKREKKTCEEVRKRSSGHLTAPFDLEKGWIAAFLFVCRECLHLSRGEEICKCFWRHCFGWRSPTFGCLSTLMCAKINQLLTNWDEKKMSPWSESSDASEHGDSFG